MEEDMTQPNIGPFSRLLQIQGADGENLGIQDIFGNLGGSMGGENPFGDGESAIPEDLDISELPYGGNPFAGDNFWNIFAGGVNPTESNFGGGSNPSAGGEGGFGGGSNPFAGGGMGGFGGGSNPSAGGEGGFGGGSNPFAGGEGGFGGENPFAGGEGGFGGGSNPFAGGGMGGFGGGMGGFGGR